MQEEEDDDDAPSTSPIVVPTVAPTMIPTASPTKSPVDPSSLGLIEGRLELALLIAATILGVSVIWGCITFAVIYSSRNGRKKRRKTSLQALEAVQRPQQLSQSQANNSNQSNQTNPSTQTGPTIKIEIVQPQQQASPEREERRSRPRLSIDRLRSSRPRRHSKRRREVEQPAAARIRRRGGSWLWPSKNEEETPRREAAEVRPARESARRSPRRPKIVRELPGTPPSPPVTPVHPIERLTSNRVTPIDELDVENIVRKHKNPTRQNLIRAESNGKNTFDSFTRVNNEIEQMGRGKQKRTGEGFDMANQARNEDIPPPPPEPPEASRQTTYEEMFRMKGYRVDSTNMDKSVEFDMNSEIVVPKVTSPIKVIQNMRRNKEQRKQVVGNRSNKTALQEIKPEVPSEAAGDELKKPRHRHFSYLTEFDAEKSTNIWGGDDSSVEEPPLPPREEVKRKKRGAAIPTSKTQRRRLRNLFRSDSNMNARRAERRMNRRENRLRAPRFLMRGHRSREDSAFLQSDKSFDMESLV